MEKSKFFDYLLASNGPALAGFKSWLFQPGMEFNSRRTWWGEQQPRSCPHEGLDLCCFEDSRGQLRQVGPDLQIPATLAGKILKLAGDFLGESIYLSHEILAADGRRLCTAYGHTRPLAALAGRPTGGRGGNHRGAGRRPGQNDQGSAPLAPYPGLDSAGARPGPARLAKSGPRPGDHPDRSSFSLSVSGLNHLGAGLKPAPTIFS